MCRRRVALCTRGVSLVGLPVCRVGHTRSRRCGAMFLCILIFFMNEHEPSVGSATVL